MKLVYTGKHRTTGASDGNTDLIGIEMYGVHFPRGVPVEVSGIAARKLEHNAFFRPAHDGETAPAMVGAPLAENTAAKDYIARLEVQLADKDARIAELEAENAALKAAAAPPVEATATLTLPETAPEIGAAVAPEPDKPAKTKRKG